jgi:energy-coupling factor transporter ATP-binding protein EcfA2
MDEATAALDEESQAAMMSLFRHELAGSSLVSIAHRQGLDVFHDRVLSLVDTVAGVRLVAVPNAAQGRERRAAAAHQPHLHPVPGPSLAARAARAVRDLAETKAGAA